NDRRGHDLMGVSHAGSYGQNTDGSYGGWGRNTPTQNLVDKFRMADGSRFDWNNPEHAADPYKNREPRFYASILYTGAPWRGDVIYASTNKPNAAGTDLVDNATMKRGTNSYTMTGYYLKKLIDPTKRGGTPNRYAPFEGSDQNLIVLRYAEMLLTYAEAKNEYSGPDQQVYEALNAVRNRGGLPELSGLGQAELREAIREERHIELCFENKRYFDIMRWRKGPEIIGEDVYGIDITYTMVDGIPVPHFTRVLLTAKSFESPKNYLMPLPDAITGRNPNLLPNNPGW
ncbi:MAG: RagB/SusD family nutrient uptake outer membrane protein, partial [Tannerella sp.]|nr:RagB/SusD family nutrient uptake outer membrane protein [Tannerella sp.]